MDRLRFGPAGVPLSSEDRSTVGGIKKVHSLGLDAMEMEFVRGVRLSIEKAHVIRDVSRSLDVVLTAHAPYYINLNSSDAGKLRASIQRIYDTARITWEAGGYSVVFHAAYYGKSGKEETYRRVRDSLKEIVKRVQDEGMSIFIRPETMGKGTQFGTLEEVVRLSQEIEMVLPCVDFAHIHARYRGSYNTYEEFRQIMEYIEEELGRYALDNMHIHFSGIEYGDKGERKHLPLQESDMNYRELIRVWKEFRIKGVAISESPILEEDALLAKRIYEEI